MRGYAFKEHCRISCLHLFFVKECCSSVGIPQLFSLCGLIVTRFTVNLRFTTPRLMFKGDYMSPPGNREFNQCRKSGGGGGRERCYYLINEKIMLHADTQGACYQFVISPIQNIQRLGLLSLTEEL